MTVPYSWRSYIVSYSSNIPTFQGSSSLLFFKYPNQETRTKPRWNSSDFRVCSKVNPGLWSAADPKPNWRRQHLRPRSSGRRRQLQRPVTVVLRGALADKQDLTAHTWEGGFKSRDSYDDVHVDVYAHVTFICICTCRCEVVGVGVGVPL